MSGGNGYSELVASSCWYGSGGHWSGQEGKQHQRYIALIPLWRYKEEDDRKRSFIAIQSRSLTPGLVRAIYAKNKR